MTSIDADASGILLSSSGSPLLISITASGDSIIATVVSIDNSMSVADFDDFSMGSHFVSKWLLMSESSAFVDAGFSELTACIDSTSNNTCLSKWACINSRIYWKKANK